MRKDPKRGQPDNAGQFAPDTRGKTPPATDLVFSEEIVSKNATKQSGGDVESTHAAYRAKRKKFTESEHDSMCPWRPPEYWQELRAEPQACQCELIAQVRNEIAESERLQEIQPNALGNSEGASIKKYFDKNFTHVSEEEWSKGKVLDSDQGSIAEKAKKYFDNHFITPTDEEWDQGRVLDEAGKEPTNSDSAKKALKWGRNSPAPARNGYQFAPEGECSYCDTEYGRGNSFFPPHRTERKPNCGGGNDFHHCTCSACF